MIEKVLFVDDDQKILNAISRQLEDVFELETIADPCEAIELIRKEGPFAVVVSDMRMPGMNGIELLAQIKDIAPDTVRIMLTGYAELQATIEAVNEGNIFRFLSKPCANDVLEKAVQDGLAQYRLICSERELLEGTLHGSIKVLSEMLSLVNPLAFGRTSRVQRIALEIGQQHRLPDLWDLKIAGMLFPLGCITVSPAALECVFSGQSVPAEESAAYAEHAQLAKHMLEEIPRLEGVAEIVAYQDKGFDGSGLPDDTLRGTDIPIGARVLKVASDFELALRQTGDRWDAWELLEKRLTAYDPDMMDSFHYALRKGLCKSSSQEVSITGLTVGMVLAKDVISVHGQLMVASGQPITNTIGRRLRDLCDKGTIGDQFTIETAGEVEAVEFAEL